MQLVALVGNGTSVVYNGDLAIKPLTDGIVAAFSSLAGTPAGNALAAFAQQVHGEEREDFEGLLGPLDAITQALPLLAGVSGPFQNVPWVAGPLGDASEALRRLHRLGLGIALDLIATRAQGQGMDQLQAGPGALTGGLIAAADGGLVTIATLNYDGLLQAVLPDEGVADLASGTGAGAVDLGDGTLLQSWPLRIVPDFPDERTIHLLHLHGSLGWLRGSTSIRKFRIDDLRAANVWARIANDELTLEPVVVLTDRKDQVPGTAPFALGYKVFADRLSTTTDWCIAGYSFLDIPVNRALADAAATRQRAGLPEPRVLVLGYGDVEALKEHINERVGDISSHLFVDGVGLPASIGSDAWSEWLSN